MMQNKYLFGITGGSGSGKSTVSDIIRQMGYDVIDCDLVSRAVTEKGTPCLMELKEEFGSDIISEEGTLLRQKLGELVFSNESKLQRLNKITHKYILKEIYRQAGEAKSSMVGIDGAVLFESGIADSLERIIAVLAERKARIERITKRDGIDACVAENRINSQKDDKFFVDNCDFVIYNNGKYQDLVADVKEVVEKLKQEE